MVDMEASAVRHVRNLLHYMFNNIFFLARSYKAMAAYRLIMDTTTIIFLAAIET